MSASETFAAVGTPLSRFKTKIRQFPGALRILSEGDSWFSFEAGRPNIITQLINRIPDSRAAWLRLEHSGDEAREIRQSQGADLERILAREKTLPPQEPIEFDAILLSMGGNDILAENLDPILDAIPAGESWEDFLTPETNPELSWRLDAVDDAFRFVIGLRDRFQPDAVIITHLYDYAFPSGKAVHFLGLTVGPWIKQRLVRHGITDADQQRELVKRLVDLNASHRLPLNNPMQDIHVLDTRGTLPAPGDWGDEIHPTSTGFSRLADRFQAKLREVFGTRLP